MFKVKSTDPGPDGTYSAYSADPSEVEESVEYETVFRIPRLRHHAQDGQLHYTIVLPKYVALERRNQAPSDSVEQPTQATSGSVADATTPNQNQQGTEPKQKVYVSYAPGDSEGYKLAQYVTRAVLDKYHVPHTMLSPKDGTLNYVDYDTIAEDHSHFVMCMSAQYFESLERQAGRPYVEAKIATSHFASQHIIGVHCEGFQWPSQQRTANLQPLPLQKAFVPGKERVLYDNLGHREAFEDALCYSVGVRPDSDIAQLPMTAALEGAGLGAFARDLHIQHGISTPDELLAVSEDMLTHVGMGSVQKAAFERMVQSEVLKGALGAVGLGSLRQGLLSEGGVQRLEGLATVSDEMLNKCCARAPFGAREARARLQQLVGKPHSAVYSMIQLPPIAEAHQTVKELVTILWSPDQSPLKRAKASELLRVKSLNPVGLEEIRQVAGMESLIKLVKEGSEAEQVAALWSLRNFAVNELHRSRLARLGGIQLAVDLIEARHLTVEVHHAAVALVQMLTTNNANNVQLTSQTAALPRLVALLYSKYRPLKVAALATIANLTVRDENREGAGRLRAIPRLVALLEASNAEVAAGAVACLSQLVLLDTNRLKTWRCGGIDKLKRIVDLRIPRVSDVAAQAIDVLMAGPRIHPNERFKTARGRTLSASDMRSSIQRLNTQDSFLGHLNISMSAFESAWPGSAGAVMRARVERPATAPAQKLRLFAGNTSVVSTEIDTPVARRDFLPARPCTAQAVFGSGGTARRAPGDAPQARPATARAAAGAAAGYSSGSAADWQAGAHRGSASGRAWSAGGRRGLRDERTRANRSASCVQSADVQSPRICAVRLHDGEVEGAHRVESLSRWGVGKTPVKSSLRPTSARFKQLS